ncbi:transcriptional regulator with XRE-family HTH domain [Paraburkholderia sp. BL8N3]|nr:transcriptional regulator with XRE-family HTH domain [Paraburkholderia sp. BL8N3]
MYGLDLDSVEYVTDRHGQTVKVVVPPKMFSALTEFWIAARRAQTASIEAHARPGQFKTSLPSMPMPEPHLIRADGVAAALGGPGVPSSKHDRHWSQLLQHMPSEPESTPAPIPPVVSPAATLSPRKTPQIYFAREFVAAVPDEVMSKVRQGVYFLRAWRDYRGFTLKDVADLFGKTKDAINWHEHGYSCPSAQTLTRFAEIFDCTLEQLTAKPGSNTAPWLILIESPQFAECEEPRAPDDTDYPDSVLAHLIDGKSPLKAWRLYRCMSVAQLADLYGASTSAIKQMECSSHLRQRTIAKLCPLLKCTPEQLLRPASMPSADHQESPASRRITEAMRAHA